MLPVGCARAVHGFLGRNIAQCSQLWMHSSAADSLYTTLGVHHAATDAEIKRAFRQAAKKWHPDLHGTSDEARLRFGQCLLAYQVLSEPEARRSYDLSQDGQHPAALRAASKLMAFRMRAVTPDLPFWEWFKPSNWAAIAQADTALAPPPSAPLALQRPLADFGHELHAALEQAYFGPPLDGLAAGELPVAFEAEHRTLPGVGSLLQVVSGQTLLGEVQLHALPRLRGDGPHQLEGQGEDLGVQLPAERWDLQDADPTGLADTYERPDVAQARHQGHEVELHFSVGGCCQLRAVRKSASGASWIEVKDMAGATEAYIMQDMLADAEGRHTHTVLEVVCKATRAWAPPPAMRVFPVRDDRYSSGGYYVEWAGHHQEGRAGWLHPGVACLLLGFRALELEAGRKRPWWFASMARRLMRLR